MFAAILWTCHRCAGGERALAVKQPGAFACQALCRGSPLRGDPWRGSA